MSIRNSNSPFGSDDLKVTKLIGSSYNIVKKVYDNLDKLTYLSRTGTVINYTTYEEGVRNTNIGDYFAVVKTDDPLIWSSLYYVVSDSLITHINDYPSADAMAEFLDTIPDQITDAKARANHTGTQAISTVSGLQAALDAKVSIDALASSTGGEMVGYDETTEYAPDTSGRRLNILSATRRPAMDGIFSSGADQRSALLAFVADSAANGQTIEWGPIDVALDVVTPTDGLRGLTVPTGSRWVFHPNTRLRAVPNAANNYEILNLWNAQDVIIEGAGAKIVGDRDDHTGITGEWGVGVSIRGSTNITIRDLMAEDCWGDGFYIGSTPEQNYCENILLDHIGTDRARRNGLSLISAKGFRCVDGRFLNTNGTLPEYGVDIEPNSPAEYLQDVVFERCYTENSATNGIGVAVGAMGGTANPVDIRIIDHNDVGSASAIYGSNDDNVPGLVSVIRPVSRNALAPGILLRKKCVTGPKWQIVDPNITDWNRGGNGATTLSSGILIYAPSGDAGTTGLGNVDIIRPNIRPLTSGTAVNAITVADSRTTTPDLPDAIRVLDPLDLAGKPCNIWGFNTFTDPGRASSVLRSDATTAIGPTGFYVYNRIPALTGNRSYTLQATLPVGIEIVFEIEAVGAGEFRIVFPAGSTLAPDALGGNLRLASNTLGSRVRLRKINATDWRVIEKIGTWTAS